jgi:arginyl-tRNA synthetase
MRSLSLISILRWKKTEENPVFYIQYAYVRTNGIIKKAKEEPRLHKINTADFEHLSAEERPLIKKNCFTA